MTIGAPWPHRGSEEEGDHRGGRSVRQPRWGSQGFCQTPRVVGGTGLTRYAAVVKGPLIRATDGGRLTDTPLETGSSYSHSTKALKLAYELLRGRGEEDLELAVEEDESGKPVLKFAHHSNRRFSQTRWRGTPAM